MSVPVPGQRWTAFGTSHRVGSTWLAGRWNPACDRQASQTAVSAHIGQDIRPSAVPDRPCSKEQCRA